MKQRWFWLIIGAGVVIPMLLCCSAAALAFGMIPPTKMIAQRYLEAVVRADITSAIELANTEPRWQIGVANNPYANFEEGLCKHIVEEDAKKDIAQFGGADLRNVRVSVTGGGGSSDTIQFALVQFEYRKPGGQAWQNGEMRLETDTNTSVFRYLCGNLKYHGP